MLALTGSGVMLVVVLELLGRRRLPKVKGERVEDVLLRMRECSMLRNLRPAELCVSDRSGHCSCCLAFSSIRLG